MPGCSRRNAVLGCLAFGAATWSAAAQALAPRTFVASHGSDAAACSLAFPCRSFAAAALQTQDAGEIVALDSAGYGPVTLAQSVTIVAPPGVHAAISAVPPNPTTGVAVDGPGARVTLRGLTINAYGAGVWFLQGAEVAIERCEIAAGSGIVADSVPPTLGVAAKLYVRDTNIRTTGAGLVVKGNVVAVADGVRIEGSGFHALDVLEGARLSFAHGHISGLQQAVWLESHLINPTTSAEIVATTLTGSGEGARVTAWTGARLALTVRDSFVSTEVYGVNAQAINGRVDVSIANSGFRNALFHALAGSAGPGAALTLQVDGTEFSGSSGSVKVDAASGGHAELSLVRSKVVDNQFGLQVGADFDGTSVVTVVVNDTLIAGNANYGLGCDGPGASVVLSGSTVTRNQTGVSVSTGCVGKTRKTNTVDANPLADVFGSWTDLRAF